MIFNWSTSLAILLLASFPRVVKILRIYEFYFTPPFYVIMTDFEFLLGEAEIEPSGIEENTDWRLSTSVSLNLSVSFFKADSLIYSFVESYFCFFSYSLSSSSFFSLRVIAALRRACYSLPLEISACKIYTIFWFLVF